MQMLPMLTEDEILDHVSPEPTSGCWIWMRGGHFNDRGYVLIYGRNAHRAVYEMLRGPIPEGLQLDHLCRVRCCVNPAHMEPVTLVENVRRGNNFIPKNIFKTHCSRGHPYSEENTYLHRKDRHCRACMAARKKLYKNDGKTPRTAR